MQLEVVVVPYLIIPRNIPIKPGESGEIEINFDTSNMPNLQSKLIKVFANVPSGSVFLRIQALVEPKIINYGISISLSFTYSFSLFIFIIIPSVRRNSKEKSSSIISREVIEL